MTGKIKIINRTDGTIKIVDTLELFKELKKMAKATPDPTDLSKNILDSGIDPEAVYAVLLMFLHDASHAEASFEEILNSCNGGKYVN